MYLLAIDMGNTTLGIGVINQGQVIHVDHIPTAREENLSFFISQLEQILAPYLQESPFCGGILSSVVPELNDTVLTAIEHVIQQDAHLVTLADILQVLPIQIEEPSSVGKDRLMDCIGAMAQIPTPLIVIDMGTATTVNMVNKKGEFVGGMIIPGVKTAVTALSAKASQLPEIALEAPKHLLGQNTVECMQSGAIYGHACMIDGIYNRLQQEAEGALHVIATGGYGELIVPQCLTPIPYDPHLQLKGLASIYLKLNVRDSECR